MSHTDEATAWAARMDAGPLADADRIALDRWLAADPLNKGALLRAQAMLCLIYEAPDRAAEMDGGPAAVAPQAEAPGIAAPARRWRWPVGFAATAAVAAAAATLLLLPGKPVSADYATRTGEVRRVALDDGSRAIINTASEVEIEIGSTRRVVTLAHGEAWFNVAKDRERPFTVQAGPIRVTAVGTAFAVRRNSGSATVTVTEGRVEIRNTADPHHIVSAGAGEATTIAFAPRLPAPRIRPARESALAWRDGDIVLDGMTLQAAVDEFNRYNIRKVTIASPQIARKSMVGYFRINQPEQFAAAAAGLVGGSVEQDGNNIVIKP
ncbi:FecR domain-containing protein [Croceibacterium sp. TMG7-5b_MA50]|uniref:FecR family protein n=1 Tax=Croceibacterium sp. TMG7-5b_MA50 TaxID=3121290 RepID=UPI003221EE1E